MDDFKIGDQVKISEEYLNIYPNWKVVDKIGTIVEVKNKNVLLSALTGNEYQLYLMRYGKLPKYPLIQLMVEIDKEKYMISQFGVVRA